MPTSANYSSITYILREHIESGAYEDYIGEDDSFIAWLPKNTNGGGLYDRMAFSDASIGGVAWGFGAAQASKRDMSGDDWQRNWYELDALLSIDHKALTHARNAPDRLEELVSSRLDNAARRFSTMLGYALWGNGGGAIDIIAARDAGSTYIDLTHRAAMWLIERNMSLQVSTDDGTGGAGVVANEIQVVSQVTRPSKRVYAEDAFDTDWAAGRYAFPRGAYANVVQGVRAWCPLTAPSATPFNGVDRSLDDRRYGVIFDPTGLSISNLAEYLVEMATYHGEENPALNGSSLAFWLNPRMVSHLQNVLGVKLRYDSSEIAMGAKGKEMMGRNGNPITVPKLFLPTDRGEIAIMTHRHIPYGDVNLLCRDSLELNTMGAMFAPFDFEDDDTLWMRHQSENAAECRMGGYPNLFVSAPHRNAVGSAAAFVPTAA